MHIAISGNIGAGKTTLTTLLAKHYKWETHFEDVENNPYLNDFYEDMQRWSFNLQIFYLNSRFTQIQEIKNSKKSKKNKCVQCTTRRKKLPWAKLEKLPRGE